MFNQFTDETNALVTAAAAHARRLGHHWVGVEHLLLAVASADAPYGEALRANGVPADRIETILLGPRLTDTIDRDALAAVGIDVDAVRAAVEQAFGPGALDRPRGRDRADLGFTRRAKECFEQAVRDAGGRVAGEHLALAVVSMRRGTVAHILAVAGVSPAVLRTAIQDRYRQAG